MEEEMTEQQFSPEYIAYILKAKALQALWKRKIGDWGTYEFAGAPVVCLREWQIYGNDEGAYPLIWLPALFQLIRVIEGRWPLVEINLYPEGSWLDDSRAGIVAADKCVDWHPEGGDLWRCEECGDSLHDQPDGSYTFGPFPEDISDEAYEDWGSGAHLSTCPHCGHARAKDLLLAAAQLAVRAVEGK